MFAFSCAEIVWICGLRNWKLTTCHSSFFVCLPWINFISSFRSSAALCTQSVGLAARTMCPLQSHCPSRTSLQLEFGDHLVRTVCAVLFGQHRTRADRCLFVRHLGTVGQAARLGAGRVKLFQSRGSTLRQQSLSGKFWLLSFFLFFSFFLLNNTF